MDVEQRVLAAHRHQHRGLIPRGTPADAEVATQPMSRIARNLLPRGDVSGEDVLDRIARATARPAKTSQPYVQSEKTTGVGQFSKTALDAFQSHIELYSLPDG